MQGYIKLYRKTMDSAIWDDPYYLKLWLYCLMKATHKEHTQLVGNQLITLQPGEFVTGRMVLSDELNKGMKPSNKQSEISWWRYLNNLAKWEMLNIKKTNKYSVVSIVKWDEYQESEQQVNNKCTSNEQQMNTNKNVKNGKNDKKKDSRQKFKFEPSDMELAELLFSYIKDNGDGINKVKNASMDKWANDIRLIRTRDGKTHEQIKRAIDWSQNHSFWKTVILSPGNLRDKYTQLSIKAKEEAKKKQTPKNKKTVSKEDFDLSE